MTVDKFGGDNFKLYKLYMLKLEMTLAIKNLLKIVEDS